MDGCSIGDSSNSSEDAGVAPGDSTKAGSRRGLSAPDSASASCCKKSRRAADNKRVVNFSLSELDGSRPKAGEGAPPPDSWSWRKYGQKPIKGSPYPRGYYRCSSSKGCPARKQVERSRVDPTMLVVTYSSDHNHAWPLPKHRTAPAVSKRTPSPPEADEEEDLSGIVQFSPDPGNSNDKFPDLISEEPSEYCWFSEAGSGQSVASPSISTDDLLLGSITEASASLYMLFPDEVFGGGGGGGDEDDSLFKDLGELPEYSVVFRRSYLERQMLEEEDRRRSR